MSVGLTSVFLCQLWIPGGQARLGYLTKVCGCIRHTYFVGRCPSDFLSDLRRHKVPHADDFCTVVHPFSRCWR
ncbi:hypothetical protein SCLCIDRAFT_1119994 [Scleroderma citrinum Foug A]|uniref:Secreted protein n=1 Tax=Scleroderma citrinum Foug A TaxID=1036808 RepID=A0A0C3DP38_9AGAM|nr:hypothetical protein SCLCIDRAFT_1119994 [Scleroderma citrinum Foug A]